LKDLKRGGKCVAKVVVVVKIMPSDAEVDMEELIRKIGEGLPEGVELREAKVKPFAFGMSVVEAAFTTPEEEGVTDKLENYLREFPEIGEVDVTMVTRL